MADNRKYYYLKLKEGFFETEELKILQSMPDMLNPELTASWEKGLDMVAKKEIEPDIFMGKLEKYIRGKFERMVVKD